MFGKQQHVQAYTHSIGQYDIYFGPFFGAPATFRIINKNGINDAINIIRDSHDKTMKKIANCYTCDPPDFKKIISILKKDDGMTCIAAACKLRSILGIQHDAEAKTKSSSYCRVM